MATILKPCKDWFFIERIEDVRSSVIYVPFNDDGKQWFKGRIFACGDNEFGLKAGDIVYYDKYNAPEYTYEGKQYHAVKWHPLSKSILCQVV